MKTTKKILFSAILIAMFIGIAGCGPEDPPDYNTPEITRKELQAHVKYLASDELKGREVGSPGAVRASEYIIRQMKWSGVLPGYRSEYLQRFRFIRDVRLGGENSLSLITVNGKREFRLSEEYRPLGFSSSGSVTGELVFAGYGITADTLQYDDYGGINAQGKIVLVLRYGPEGDNPRGEFGEYLSLHYKAENARDHGASGLIVISGPQPYPEDELVELRYDGRGDVGIPVVSASRVPFESLFINQRDSLREVQADLNLHKVGNGFRFDGVRIQMQTDGQYVEKMGRNVVGYVGGATDSLLIIGAHYDHLGLGGAGSLAPDTVAVHNGADDNASGTAALIELAEYFAAENRYPYYTLLFVAFTGKERSLLGSSEFVKSPPYPLEDCVGMVNMDMIGRPKDSTIVIGGTGTSAVWDSLLETVNRDFGWNITPRREGYGQSDHSSFYRKEIPVLFFFTGVHEDYHRPTDDWDKLEYGLYLKVVKYVAAVIETMSSWRIAPDFIETGQPPEHRGGLQVSLQIIPDYTANIQGLRVAEVQYDGPAAAAGIRPGDVIIRFGDKAINNIYDYTIALQEIEPGAVVDIIALRDGNRRRFSVKIEATEQPAY